ncbi:hypothetical protein APF79_07590 [bacterium BRH_c32]|nr:MAG: hypothetical protein APF79_07590 [bacterium BRH_c32]
MPEVFVGTAGWSYDDWKEVFYPSAQSKSFDWLTYYSQYFNVVEVNSTYYTYPNRKVIEGWLRKTEELADFRFIIKLNQDFTHKKIYSEEEILSFRWLLDTLNKNNRLAGILIQFPYSFNETTIHLEYLGNLLEVFEQYEIFLEFRHNSWQKNEIEEFAKEKGIAICTIDQPILGAAVSFEPIVTSESYYLRLHGRNKSEWKNSIRSFGTDKTYSEQSARYDYLYSPAELIEIEMKSREIFDRVKKVFVIFNNHPNGGATVNALQFLHLLKNRTKIAIPPTTLKAYPRLKKIAIG